MINKKGLVIILLVILAICVINTCNAIEEPKLTIVFEDQHQVVIENWYFMYRGRTTTNAPAGKYYRVEYKTTNFLVKFNDKDHTLPANEIKAISWHYGKRAKTQFSADYGEAFLEKFSTALTNGETMVSTVFTPSRKLIPGRKDDSNFRLERVFLMGETKSKSNQDIDFSCILNEMNSELISPSQTVVEIRFGS